MNKKLFPLLILICALGLSSTAAFYSITGLSMLFSMTKTPVIIMASFLELSKVTIASFLQKYWSKIKWLMKFYLIIALLVLMAITSAGIYGLLSSGYQGTINKNNISEKEILIIDKQIQTQEKNKELTQSQLLQIQQSISQLRQSLGNNNQSHKDKQGNILITSSSQNRKAYEKQLNYIQEQEKQLQFEIQKQDSTIIKLTNNKFEVELKSESSNELGPLKYLANLTNQSMDKIINWLLLMLIFVFDPLAIILIIAASWSFNLNKPTTPEGIFWEKYKNKLKQSKTNKNEIHEEEPTALANSQYVEKQNPNDYWKNEGEGEIKTYN